MTNNHNKNSNPPIDSGDAAWVSVTTTLPVEQVRQICADIEVIMRLNPYYFFDSWQQQGDSYEVKYRNQSNNQEIQQSFTVNSDTNELEVIYENSIKNKTVLRIERRDNGTQLTLIDDYSHLGAQEREQRSHEADKSLQAWGESIYTYFERLTKWSWIPGWRTYMRRVWIPMKPSARRVVWFLYLITLAEFAFFLLILAIWVVEQARGPAGI